MTELFGLDLFDLGLGLFGSVFDLRLIMPRVTWEHRRLRQFMQQGIRQWRRFLHK